MNGLGDRVCLDSHKRSVTHYKKNMTRKIIMIRGTDAAVELGPAQSGFLFKKFVKKEKEKPTWFFAYLVLPTYYIV